MKKLTTYDKILKVAKKEFLANGFEKTSIRDIGKIIGISSTALYRHFENKEAIFATLLKPMLEDIEKMFESREEFYLGDFDLEIHLKMWIKEPNDLDALVDNIYKYNDEWKLVLTCSEGTSFNDFFQTMVNRVQINTLKYLDVLREKGLSVNEVDPVELHFIMSAYYSSVIEIVKHELTYEDAVHYVQTLKNFFYPGWKNLLGI